MLEIVDLFGHFTRVVEIILERRCILVFLFSRPTVVSPLTRHLKSERRRERKTRTTKSKTMKKKQIRQPSLLSSSKACSFILNIDECLSLVDVSSMEID